MKKQPFNLNPDFSSDGEKARLREFEQLSAYVDGEATPEECRQVQKRLDHDPEFKRQYLHLHQIRQGIQAMPIPTGQSPQHLGQQVFKRLRQTRFKVVSLWGSGAIAALFVAGIVGQIPGTNQAPVANRPVKTTTPTMITPNQPSADEALVVALNRPVLQIPKLATAATDNP